MRKLIIIVVMLASMTVQAQVHLNVGQDSKAVTAEALEKGTNIGRYEESSVWLNSTRSVSSSMSCR